MKTLLDREDLVFNPPELGCVLYLSGLPGGGSKVYDRSPYSNHGTITGATWKKLPSGLWCLSFDGADDYIEIPHSANLNPGTGDFSVACWVKNEVSALSALLSKWDASSPYHGWTFGIAADGTIRFDFHYVNSSHYRQRISISSVNDGAWHHVVGTYKFNSYPDIYVDGVLNNGATAKAGNIVTIDTNTALRLGMRTSGDWKYAGLIALPKLVRGTWNALDIQNSFNREKHLFGVW